MMRKRVVKEARLSVCVCVCGYVCVTFWCCDRTCALTLKRTVTRLLTHLFSKVKGGIYYKSGGMKVMDYV